MLIYNSDVAHESVAGLQELDEYKVWMAPAAALPNEDASDVDALQSTRANANEPVRLLDA